MPLSFAKILIPLLACLTASLLVAAEDVLTLEITGDKIRLDDSLGEATAENIVASYYAKLSHQERLELQALQSELAELMIEYRIAFSAADTAEVNSILSAITQRWVAVLDKHQQLFVAEATVQLRESYSEIYPLLAPN